MSTHLTNKEIENYISGLASSREAEKTERHLNSCPECRKIADVLSSAVAFQPIDSVPGDHVREAVAAEWHRIHNEAVKNRYSAAEKTAGIKNYLAAAAAAASVVIAVSSYLFFSGIRSSDNYNIAITSISNEVHVNDSAAASGRDVKSGDVIVTGIQSSALLTSDGYSLDIGESSSLKIASAGKTGGILFILNEGSAVSKSHGKTKYSFQCGLYRIAPAGTEFMIQFSENRLNVSVTEGRVKVTGRELQVEIPAGGIWSSENPSEVKSSATGGSVSSGSAGSGKNNTEQKSSAEKKKAGITEPAKYSAGSGGENNGRETLTEKENPDKEREERIENAKLSRELREEMSEMKKEQRKEQRREKKGRNKD